MLTFIWSSLDSTYSKYRIAAFKTENSKKYKKTKQTINEKYRISGIEINFDYWQLIDLVNFESLSG